MLTPINHLPSENGGRKPNQPTTGPSGAAARKMDLIWNMTRVCPFSCGICCVAAVQPRKHGNVVELAMDSQTSPEGFPYTHGNLTVFEQASLYLQKKGLELDLAGKLRVLDHIAGFPAKVDFSGGDPLITDENFTVIQAAARRLGRDGVSVTATGPGISRYSPQELAEVTGEVNFTYDGPVLAGSTVRPDGYAASNLRMARSLAKAGVKTRAELPLTRVNVNQETVARIYRDLNEAGIAKVLVMRLFPVGRGSDRGAAVPSPTQYRNAIAQLRELEKELGHPQVKLQCALRFFDQPDVKENPCDIVRESLGVMANGVLLASPWAVNRHGKPLDDAWILGNLAETPLGDLLLSPKARQFEARLAESFGHCRIHAFLNSQKLVAIDRIFDLTDPMYAPTERAQTVVPAVFVGTGEAGGVACAPETAGC
jgi:MoaA/NifB/PqqE/SkfB family radical SAM enzyme